MVVVAARDTIVFGGPNNNGAMTISQEVEEEEEEEEEANSSGSSGSSGRAHGTTLHAHKRQQKADDDVPSSLLSPLLSFPCIYLFYSILFYLFISNYNNDI